MEHMHSSSERRKCALIVDDDPMVAMLVEDVLRGMRIDGLVNLNLQNALAELDVSEFDVALVDMELRRESARPLVLALIARDIPFLVMSGADQSALVAEFPQILAISKPFDVKALESAVSELLGRKARDFTS
jgi:DNA-binding response OmpR family regulator